jgi:hypothetical protein
MQKHQSIDGLEKLLEYINTTIDRAKKLHQAGKLNDGIEQLRQIAGEHARRQQAEDRAMSKVRPTVEESENIERVKDRIRPAFKLHKELLSTYLKEAQAKIQKKIVSKYSLLNPEREHLMSELDRFRQEAAQAQPKWDALLKIKARLDEIQRLLDDRNYNGDKKPLRTEKETINTSNRFLQANLDNHTKRDKATKANLQRIENRIAEVDKELLAIQQLRVESNEILVEISRLPEPNVSGSATPLSSSSAASSSNNSPVARRSLDDASSADISPRHRDDIDSLLQQQQPKVAPPGNMMNAGADPISSSAARSSPLPLVVPLQTEKQNLSSLQDVVDAANSLLLGAGTRVPAPSVILSRAEEQEVVSLQKSVAGTANPHSSSAVRGLKTPLGSNATSTNKRVINYAPITERLNIFIIKLNRMEHDDNFRRIKNDLSDLKLNLSTCYEHFLKSKHEQPDLKTLLSFYNTAIESALLGPLGSVPKTERFLKNMAFWIISVLTLGVANLASLAVNKDLRFFKVQEPKTAQMLRSEAMYAKNQTNSLFPPKSNQSDERPSARPANAFESAVPR